MKKSENMQATTTAELVTETFKSYGKVEEITLNNTALIEHTQKIHAYLDVTKAGQLGVCYELGKVAIDETYKTAGFKSLTDYGSALFDFKTSTCSLYARVGGTFVELDENGKPVVRKGLPRFTVGQLIELLPLYKDGTENGDKALTELLNNGDFGQFSTTKAIRNAVKSALAIEGTSKEIDSDATATSKGKKAKSVDVKELPVIDLLNIIKEATNTLLSTDNAPMFNSEETEKLLQIIGNADYLIERKSK